MATFYLGTDSEAWLEKAGVRLFISDRQLRKRRCQPVAIAPWSLDSGGFTELSRPPYRWLTTPGEYVERIRRYHDEIGMLEWAAPQDWMCEPFIIERTGLTMHEHQARTVDNLLELRSLAPPVPIIPVLQGFALGDYERHASMYADAGVDLTAEPLVGLGSVCRRQATDEAGAIVAHFHIAGLALHGFGVSMRGLARYGSLLASADSMAWSFYARTEAWKARPEGRPMIAGHQHRSCHHCLPWALEWRRQAIAWCDTASGVQTALAFDTPATFTAPRSVHPRAPGE